MCVCVCQECDHNLCKPDYNLTIKFKIQLVAMLVADRYSQLYCDKYIFVYVNVFCVIKLAIFH